MKSCLLYFMVLFFPWKHNRYDILSSHVWEQDYRNICFRLPTPRNFGAKCWAKNPEQKLPLTLSLHLGVGISLATNGNKSTSNTEIHKFTYVWLWAIHKALSHSELWCLEVLVLEQSLHLAILICQFNFTCNTQKCRSGSEGGRLRAMALDWRCLSDVKESTTENQPTVWVHFSWVSTVIQDHLQITTCPSS